MSDLFCFDKAYTAATILISTYTSGSSNPLVPCSAPAHDPRNPGIPRFIHRLEVVFISQEKVASRMLDLLLPCFSSTASISPACWRFAQKHRRRGFPVHQVVERVVVDYYIRPAGFSIDTTIVIILSSLSFHFRAAKTAKCEVAVTTSTGESALILT